MAFLTNIKKNNRNPPMTNFCGLFFSSDEFWKVVTCSQYDKYFYTGLFNLLLILFLLLSHLSLTHVSSIQPVFVFPYPGNEGSVGPIVHHAGMWGELSPGGRSLVYSGWTQLHHSWRLLDNVGQTGERHFPPGQGPNSSPLQARAEDIVWQFK